MASLDQRGVRCPSAGVPFGATDAAGGIAPEVAVGVRFSCWILACCRRRLSIRVDRLLNALPSLEALVVQASDIDLIHPAAPIVAPNLRRLVLRAEALNPESLSLLGRGVYPALSHLELWLGRIAYGWGSTVDILAPLLESAAMPALRHLKLVSDLGDALVDQLAGSRLLPGLSTLDLSHGVLGDSAAARLSARFQHFAHLDRLTLVDNALTPAGVARVCGLGPNIVVGAQCHGGLDSVPFDPPRVSLFDGFGR